MKVKISKDYDMWESMLKSDLRRLHDYRALLHHVNIIIGKMLMVRLTNYKQEFDPFLDNDPAEVKNTKEDEELQETSADIYDLLCKECFTQIF